MVTLLVNNRQVDIIEDVAISLNFSISDVRTPDKRNAAYSKTITLPGSKNNNRLFSHIFDISVFVNTVDFNPNKKASCSLFVDDQLMINGYLRLLKINNNNGAITYEVCIYDNVADLFKSFGEDLISELDLSDLTHDWTEDNIVASWDTSDTSGYYYPMVDYGKTNLTNWEISDFIPAISFYEIWTRIFSKYGFVYTSNFIESDLFKQLFLLSSNPSPKLSQAQIDNFYVSAGYSTDFGVLAPLVNTKLIFDTEIQDDNNSYNNTTGIYSASITANHNVRIEVPVTLTRAVSGGVPTSLWEETRILVRFLPNKTDTPLSTINTYSTSPFIRIPAGDTTVTETVVLEISSIELQAMGSIGSYATVIASVPIWEGFASSGIYTPATIEIGQPTIEYTMLSRQVISGDPVDPTVYLPQMKVKDWVKGVIQMFNLYLDTKTDDNNIIIEPRDDYYDQGVIVDWTDKLDRSSNIELTPIAELSYRQFKLTYTEDTDYLNELYTKQTSRVYGDMIKYVDNDFSDEINIIKVPFSPTVIEDSSGQNRPIPAIYKYDANGNPVRYEGFKPRVILRGGSRMSSTWEIKNEDDDIVSYSVYPMSGMVTTLATPTESIEFGLPAQLYYTSLTYTNNNLYNKYYSQMIANISSPSSLMFKGKFYLRASDIYKFRYYNTIQIDGVNFKVNKITDFDPVNPGLTTVELLKDVYTTSFIPTNVEVPTTNPNPQEFDVIDGGEDSIQRLFYSPYYQIVEGGEDEVRDPSATDNIFIIYG